eukprot:2518151-Prymnesium_polylepis.1
MPVDGMLRVVVSVCVERLLCVLCAVCGVSACNRIASTMLIYYLHPRIVGVLLMSPFLTIRVCVGAILFVYRRGLP